jgi:hypothetical protein
VGAESETHVICIFLSDSILLFSLLPKTGFFMVMCVGVGFEWFADDSSFASISFSVLFFKFVGKKKREIEKNTIQK